MALQIWTSNSVQQASIIIFMIFRFSELPRCDSNVDITDTFVVCIASNHCEYSSLPNIPISFTRLSTSSHYRSSLSLPASSFQSSFTSNFPVRTHTLRRKKVQGKYPNDYRQLSFSIRAISFLCTCTGNSLSWKSSASHSSVQVPEDGIASCNLTGHFFFLQAVLISKQPCAWPTQLLPNFPQETKCEGNKTNFRQFG